MLTNSRDRLYTASCRNMHTDIAKLRLDGFRQEMLVLSAAPLNVRTSRTALLLSCMYSRPNAFVTSFCDNTCRSYGDADLSRAHTPETLVERGSLFPRFNAWFGRLNLTPRHYQDVSGYEIARSRYHRKDQTL